MAMAELETAHFASLAEFDGWLEENEDASPGLWLVIAKKGSGVTSITYAEAVEAALMHGWIDGQARSFDEKTYRQRFTPRRPKSIWSERNCLAVTEMIADGRMRPRGLAEIQRAKADGRWDRAYAGSKDAQPHPDFLAALEQSPAAAEFYATLSSQNRFAIYFRIHGAKREDTRARRIATFIEMLERGETVY